MDRLSARLGEQQVHGLKAVADHRPETSWAMADAEEDHARSTGSSLKFAERPLWLLSQPKPLQQSGWFALVTASGPERIESGWWDGGDVQRDYFIAHTQQGATLWVFKDLNDGSWHLHGFWS
jgi:protein ImuB